MAKRFGKEGSAGMQGPLRGPLWGEFCYLVVSKPPLFSTDPQSRAERKAKSSRGGQGEDPTLCPSPLTWKSEHGTAPEVSVCGAGGSLAPPRLKILDKNANPEGKDRTRKESVNHEAPAPHPQPQLHGPHSCRGGET